MKAAINIPIFDVVIHYVQGKKDLKKFRKFKGKETALESAGFACNLGKSEFLVYLHNKDCLNTLVHECVHVTHFIMQNAWIPVNIKNTEIQAYLCGYITEQIILL